MRRVSSKEHKLDIIIKNVKFVHLSSVIISFICNTAIYFFAFISFVALLSYISYYVQELKLACNVWRYSPYVCARKIHAGSQGNSFIPAGIRCVFQRDGWGKAFVAGVLGRGPAQ